MGYRYSGKYKPVRRVIAGVQLSVPVFYYGAIGMGEAWISTGTVLLHRSAVHRNCDRQLARKKPFGLPVKELDAEACRRLFSVNFSNPRFHSFTDSGFIFAGPGDRPAILYRMYRGVEINDVFFIDEMTLTLLHEGGYDVDTLRGEIGGVVMYARFDDMNKRTEPRFRVPELPDAILQVRRFGGLEEK